ncbi:MAG: alpha/beta fold hydrolase [Endozoicomonadaceae bacterium]|nr:alpha/beta fold hydrolase [Endozoicomonadaceae bacterium]
MTSNDSQSINHILHSQIKGTGFPLILLHGLFASHQNLGYLSQYLSHFSCIHLLDLRNHGQSFHAQAFSYRDMAEDILKYMQYHQISQAHFVGHSMGGKVAMSMALCYPAYVNTLTALDIAPVDYQQDPHHPSHRHILNGLHAISQATIYTKEEANQLLKQYVPQSSMRGFLLRNLKKNNQNEWILHINIQSIMANHRNILGIPAGETPFTKPTLFIKGENSCYIQEAYRPQTLKLFPTALLNKVPGTGHELHVEKPRAISRLIQRFITATAS